ncbi:MAG: hypothetical protein HZB67_01370 [Candidatus Aenigmarchaeota archaeon]|nr:hypothetical protein [Candidatus Aenigmarchaeota archaeon]
MLPLCIRCKGKGLCGKPCPILNRMNEHKKEIMKIKNEFAGSSVAPFIGYHGYPKVNLGILAPAQLSTDAWMLDAPSYWYSAGYDIEKIINARSMLINSRDTSSVILPKGRLVDIAQEIAMSSAPVDADFFLKKSPRPSISLDIRAPPIGAPAQLEKVELSSEPKIPRAIDYVVNDDLSACGAVQELYKRELDVNQIIKIISVGLLGMKKRLVPTRWSITAVDDMVSKDLVGRIKDYPKISSFELFSNEYLGNHFEILLMPSEWKFEVIEGKMPGSCWNPAGNETYIYSDWERHFGRKDYASEVTGAYYSARLGVCEHLCRRKKQAAVLILREVKPEYMVPCGVWVIREAVRNAFSKKPEIFNSLDESLNRAFSRITLPKKSIFRVSLIMREFKLQKKLTDF